jgi:hypothetical protein
MPRLFGKNSRHTRTDLAARKRGYSEFYSIAALAVASQLFTNAYPVFIGALESSGRATPAQLGRLVAVEYFCMAVAATFTGKVLSANRMKQVAFTATLVQIAAVIATTYVSGDHLLLVRGLFAAACGVQVCIQYEAIAAAPRPGRLVGLCTTVVVLVAIPMSWLASNYVYPTFGVDGVIFWFGLPSLLAVLGSLMLPSKVDVLATHTPTHAQPNSRISAASLWILLSVFGWSAWISVLWVYSEDLSKSIGLPDSASHAAVIASLVCSLGGAGLGAATAEKLPAVKVLGIGLLVCLAQVIAFLAGVGSTAYVAWFGAFGFLGYFLVPFFVKTLVAADHDRPSVAFFPAAQYCGGSLGPLLASLVVAPGQYRGGLLVALADISAAVLTFWIGLAVSRYLLKSAPT